MIIGDTALMEVPAIFQGYTSAQAKPVADRIQADTAAQEIRTGKRMSFPSGDAESAFALACVVATFFRRARRSRYQFRSEAGSSRSVATLRMVWLSLMGSQVAVPGSVKPAPGWSVHCMGVRAPVRGRVCMNMAMIDVSDAPDARVGTPVTLLGVAGEEHVSAEDLGGADVHTRFSGVADHHALDDEYALELVRGIVATLNTRKQLNQDIAPPEDPLYDPSELYGVVPQTFREVFAEPVRTVQEHAPEIAAEVQLGVGDGETLAAEPEAAAQQELAATETALLEVEGELRVEAEVIAVGSGSLDLRVVSVASDPEPSPRLVLVQALAKNDRDDRAIEAATECGVDEVVP